MQMWEHYKYDSAERQDKARKQRRDKANRDQQNNNRRRQK